jgi:hypothetical protein
MSSLTAWMIEICMLTSFPLPVLNLLLSMGATSPRCVGNTDSQFWAEYDQDRIYVAFLCAALVGTRFWYTAEARALYADENGTGRHTRACVCAFLYAVFIDVLVLTWTFGYTECSQSDVTVRSLCDAVPSSQGMAFYLYIVNVVVLWASAWLLWGS